MSPYDQGLPGRDTGRGQSGGLFVGEVFGDFDEPLLGQDDELLEEPVTIAAERGGPCLRLAGTMEPLLGEGGRNASSRAYARHALTNGHHLANTVRNGHQRETLSDWIVSGQDLEIPRVERDSPHPEQDLTASRNGVGPMDNHQPFEADAPKLICPQLCPFPSPRRRLEPLAAAGGVDVGMWVPVQGRASDRA